MEFVLYGIVFAMGILVRHLLFKDTSNFEQAIWKNLYAGKQVILSVDADAYIFELHGDRLRITKATAELLPVMEEDNVHSELVTDDMAGERSDKSSGSDDSLH